jgi:hypothetical protein
MLLSSQSILHGDDPGGPGNLEFEVGITRDGHEFDITRPPQDDMVRVKEVDYFECDCLGAVDACIPEGDRQGDLSEGDRLLAQDQSVKQVWVALELVLGEPQSPNGVKVHEVEAAGPIHKGLSEPGCPDQQVDNEGKPPWSRDAIHVVRPMESDQGFVLAHVLWDCCTHRVDRPVGELEPVA